MWKWEPRDRGTSLKHAPCFYSVVREAPIMTETVDAHVLEQFQITKKVGQGAYGIVWQAIHRESGNAVALKKCFDAFRNNTDSKRTFREVMYLKALSGHENIVNILGVLPSSGDRDLYITFEYMQTDLSHVIKAKLLTEIHIKFIAYQTLRALKYIHSAELIHRDIKPSNILIDDNCCIKICDFGLMRSVDEKLFGNVQLTDYVMTRWYRAPEVLFGSKMYTKGVDLWSVGCIIGENYTFGEKLCTCSYLCPMPMYSHPSQISITCVGEMIRGRPLMAGASTMAQIQKVLEVTGNPTDQTVASWQSPFAQAMLNNANAKQRLQLNELCPNMPRDAKRMLKRLFRLDPNERITAEAALEHEYLGEFHNPETEPSYSHGPIDTGINGNSKLSAEQYRIKLYEALGINARTCYTKARKVTLDGTDNDAGI